MTLHHKLELKLGVSKTLDLNLSPSHAHENENMNALYDAWVSLDDNDYTSSDLSNTNSHTSDSASDNDLMGHMITSL